MPDIMYMYMYLFQSENETSLICPTTWCKNMSRQCEKTNNVDSDQVWHKPGCTATGDG